MAPGLVSAGLGSVPITQTFLDISQGNRVNENLYDGELPSIYLRDGEVPPRVWDRIVERADSAPAQIEPGLLAATVLDAGLPVTRERRRGLGSLIAVDRGGRVADGSDPAQGSCGAGREPRARRRRRSPELIARPRP